MKKATRPTRSLERRLAAYSAVAGVALAAGAAPAAAQVSERAARSAVPLAQPARAWTPQPFMPPTDPTVEYTDIDPDVVITDLTAGDGATGTAFDIDGDTQADFVIANYYNATFYGGYRALFVYPFAPGGFIGDTPGLIYASKLAYGDLIGPTGNFVADPGNYIRGGRNFPMYASYGPWAGGGEGYLGLQFAADAGGAATTHFAWIRLEPAVGFTSITVKDYAYETDANTAINAATLPVELTVFTAVTDGDAVTLEWETASETNNAGFEVQMLRTDGDVYAPLSFIDGAGTTTDTRTYSHTVEGLRPGTYSFRLRQVDFDGAFAYSPEVEATIEVGGTHFLTQAFPNPARGTTQLALAVGVDQHVSVSVYDVTGRLVSTVLDESMQGGTTQRLSVDTSGFSTGIYLVRVQGETFSETRRITVQ